MANQTYNDCKTDFMICKVALKTESDDHSRQSLQTCSICNKQFPSGKTLDEHILIHTDAIRQIYRATGGHIPQVNVEEIEKLRSTSHCGNDKNETFTERPKGNARMLDKYADYDSREKVAGVNYSQEHIISEDHDDSAGEERVNGGQQQTIRLANTVAVKENNSPNLFPSLSEDKQLNVNEANVVSDGEHSTNTHHIPELFPLLSFNKNGMDTIHEKHCEDETKSLEKWTSSRSENPSVSHCFSNQNMDDYGKTYTNTSDNQIATLQAIHNEYNADPDEDACLDFEGVNLINENPCVQKEYSSDQFEKSVDETRKKQTICNHTESFDVQADSTEKCDNTNIKNINVETVNAKAYDNLQREQIENVKLVCHLCEKQFGNKKTFDLHINEHSCVDPKKTDCIPSSEIDSTCDLWNKQFKSPTHLQEHRALHFDKDQCSQSPNPQSNYRSQRKMYLKNGQRLHTCSTCNRKFKQSAHLKDHIRTHTGERPFRCSICDKSFTQKSNLKTHRLLHGKLNVNDSKFLEKRASYDHCKKQFKIPTLLQEHKALPSDKNQCRQSLNPPSNYRSKKKMYLENGKRSHTCSVCNRKFKQSGHLKDHIRTHTGERPFRCSICDKSFTTKSNLKTHRLLHGKQNVNDSKILEKRASREHCKNQFKIPTHLQEHKALHSDKNQSSQSPDPPSNYRTKKKMFLESGKRLHTCSVCNRKFKSSGHLKDHIRTHTGEKPFRCSICDKSFTQKSNLKTHRLSHEKHYLSESINNEKRAYNHFEKSPVSYSNGSTSQQSNSTGSNLGRQSEKTSDIVFQEHVSLIEKSDHAIASVKLINKPEHQYLIARYNQIDRQNNGTSYKEGEREYTPKQPYLNKLYTCKICGRKGIARLRSHMQTHAEKSHPCPVCGRLFQRKGSISQHMSTHIKNNSYSCEICGKQQADLSSLRNHLIYHTGEKRFTCEICGKRFMWSSSFHMHVRRHTEAEEMQCTCDLCNKTFANKDVIRQHITNMHFSKKTFRCTFCSKTFKLKYKLKSHMTIHTGEKPHECDICKKRFRQSKGLKAHLFSHSGQQPFSCKQCNQHFKRPENLKTHMLIHDGKKPHSCSICGKNFRQRGSVKIHIMRVHDKR